jgi:RecB family exonuclease
VAAADPDGAEPVAPHPFHDELSTRLAPGSLEACALPSERLLDGGAAPFAAATVAVAPGAPMAQRAAWRVPGDAVAPVRDLSASSLETLLGCPFRWALEHQAGLRPGRGVDLPEGARLLGDFAHRILQDMLCGPAKLDFDRAGEAEAHAWAARAFDDRVATEAAPLVRRGAEVERDRARTLVADAAAALLRLLRQGGWRPVDAEREVSGTFAGRRAMGYVDLVVEKGGREAVVDLKLSGLRYRRDALASGHALQLALYASLLGGGKKAMPPTGYFILSEGQLLTVDAGDFPGAAVVEGPTTREALAGAEEGFRYWDRVLSRGLLPSLQDGLPWEEAVTGAAGPPPEEGTPARRELPCAFCHYAAVCVPPAAEEVSP